MTKIKELNKGDSARTMMHTEVANEVIKRVNALSNVEVKPDGLGTFKVEGEKAVLELGEKTLFFGIANGELAAWEQGAKSVPIDTLA